MGLYDRYQRLIPKMNPSGLVMGKDMNTALNYMIECLSAGQNLGAYLVHPNQIGGAFPTIWGAIEQAIQEVPAGVPIVVGLLPNTVYNENVEIPQEAAEIHDFYFINQFEDYTDSEGTMKWKGSLTLPEIHTWPSGRQKMLNIFGIQTEDFTINMDSGWAMNLRRALMDNLYVIRTHQAEGARLWAHDCILRGNFRMRDVDDGGGSGSAVFSHCYMEMSDTGGSSFVMRGSYPLNFIQNFCQCWATSGAGIMDLRPPVGSYSGHIYIVDSSIYVYTGVQPARLFVDAGNAEITWQGMDVIQHLGGPIPALDLGAFSKVYGWPNCRWGGTMPTNPPRGTRASDDSVDYRDKTWDGGHWV